MPRRRDSSGTARLVVFAGRTRRSTRASVLAGETEHTIEARVAACVVLTQRLPSPGTSTHSRPLRTSHCSRRTHRRPQTYIASAAGHQHRHSRFRYKRSEPGEIAVGLTEALRSGTRHIESSWCGVDGSATTTARRPAGAHPFHRSPLSHRACRPPEPAVPPLPHSQSMQPPCTNPEPADARFPRNRTAPPFHRLLRMYHDSDWKDRQDPFTATP